MALGSIASSPPPSSNAQSSNAVTFDNSGFAVNVGGGAASSTKYTQPTATAAVQSAVSGVAGLLSSPVTVIVVGLALFLYLKHK